MYAEAGKTMSVLRVYVLFRYLIDKVFFNNIFEVAFDVVEVRHAVEIGEYELFVTQAYTDKCEVFRQVFEFFRVIWVADVFEWAFVIVE